MPEPQSQKPAAATRHEPDAAKQTRELFEKIDVNGDQVVTLPEVDAFRHALLRDAARSPTRDRTLALSEAQTLAAQVRAVDQFQLKMPDLAQLSSDYWPRAEGSHVTRKDIDAFASIMKSVRAGEQLAATLEELFATNCPAAKDGFLTAEELLKLRKSLVNYASLGAAPMDAQHLATRIAHLEVLAANVGALQTLNKDEYTLGADTYGITRKDVDALRTWQREMRAYFSGDAKLSTQGVRQVAVDIGRQLDEILDPADSAPRR